LVLSSWSKNQEPRTDARRSIDLESAVTEAMPTRTQQLGLLLLLAALAVFVAWRVA
jgi:hypothetical protein